MVVQPVRNFLRGKHGGGLYGLNPVASLFAFMEKQEILDALKASREFNTNEDTELWRKAFEVFNKSTGHRLTTRPVCSKCFTMVKEWLLKEQ